jgi:hypothetical protein
MELFNKEDIKAISACASEYKLLPWIKEEKLVLEEMFGNPNAIHYFKLIFDDIEKNPNSLYLRLVSHNPNIIHFIESRGNINYADPNQIHLIEATHSSKWFESIFLNPNAIHLIEEMVRQEDDYQIELAQRDYNSELVEKIRPKYNWEYICSNPNAVHLIEEKLKTDFVYINEVCKPYLYGNPNAGNLTQITMEKIQNLPNEIYDDCINSIFRNPAEIKLIKQLLEFPIYSFNINLSRNPSIFELEKYNKEIYKVLCTIN